MAGSRDSRGPAPGRPWLFALLLLVALCLGAAVGTSAGAQESTDTTPTETTPTDTTRTDTTTSDTTPTDTTPTDTTPTEPPPPEPKPWDVIRAEGYARSIVYQSPQDFARYTSWLGAWTMPDGSLMIAFTQATGPLDRPAVSPDVLHLFGLNSLPLTRDFSHLDLRAIYLRSTDGGATWDLYHSDSFQAIGPHGYSGQAAIGLSDGTILRRVNGYDNQGFSDAPATAYLQRLEPGASDWSAPQVLMDPSQYTYQLSRIQRLSDGRLIATGNYWDVPAGQSYANLPPSLTGWLLMVSSDEGHTWQNALTEPAAQADRAPPGEWDTAELPNGDLLAMMRSYAVNPDGSVNTSVQIRRQALLRKQGDGWVMDPPVATPFAPSGHPELLTTRQGVILYIATTGVPGLTHGIYYTADAGATWKPLDFDPPRTYQSAYYPISLETGDDTVYVFGHRGGDDNYTAGLDQAVIMDKFHLRTYTKDELPPDSPTIDDAPATGSPLRDVEYTFFGSTGNYECSLDDGDYAPCTSPHDLTGLDVGDHTFRVRAVGADDQRSQPAEDSFSVRDTVDPQITTAPADPTTATSATVAFSGENSDFVTFDCAIDGQPVTPCAPGKQATQSGLSVGRHTAVVEQQLGGYETKEDARSWEVQPAAATPRIHAGPPATTTHRSATYFTFSGSDGAKFSCWVDGRAIAASLCAGGAALTPGLAAGAHTFTVKQTVGQNTSQPAAWTWTIADLAAAAPGFATAPPDATSTNTAQFALSAPGGMAWRCRLDTAPYSSCAGIKTLTGLKPGPHTFDSYYTLAGVTSQTAGRSWQVNAATPSTLNAPTLTAGPPARGVSGSAATFRWLAVAGQSYLCRLDSATPAPCAGGTMTYNVAPGDHAFGVRTTRGSAASSDERVYRWRVQPAPRATGLSVTPSPLAICAYPRAVSCDQSTPQLNGSLTAPPGAPTLLTVTVSCTAAPCGPRTYFTNVVEVPPGQTAIGPLPLPTGYRPGAHRVTVSVDSGFGPNTAATANFTVATQPLLSQAPIADLSAVLANH